MCQRCHKYAPVLPDSCPHCLAWGLFKTTSGICHACRDWRRRNPGQRPSPGCDRVDSLNGGGLCRLCWRRSRALACELTELPGPEAVTGGHQLFISDLEQRLALATPAELRRKRRAPTTRSRTRPRPSLIVLVRHHQLVLMPAARDLTRLTRHPDPPQPALEAVAVEQGERFGWAVDTVSAVRRGLRLLPAPADTPGAAIRAGDVRLLRRLGLPVDLTTGVLRVAGALDDDLIPVIVTWFNDRVRTLPAPMAEELRLWFTISREGSTTPPRTRPRNDRTIRNQFTVVLPVLRQWARGHQSLREITRADVHAALAQAGAQRTDLRLGLRAIFRVLKGRRRVFNDPTSQIPAGTYECTIPLPQRSDDLRQALASSDPTRAALAALLIFHGLRPRQLRPAQRSFSNRELVEDEHRARPGGVGRGLGVHAGLGGPAPAQVLRSADDHDPPFEALTAEPAAPFAHAEGHQVRAGLAPVALGGDGLLDLVEVQSLEAFVTVDLLFVRKPGLPYRRAFGYIWRGMPRGPDPARRTVRTPCGTHTPRSNWRPLWT
ncbi:hypothetical protein [Actinomadura rubrisoli]|uniref:Core-binding (CB) domain-containing protein n=1 Tax=Actinomadura rubrisoli TaxID=2530368 RepID=A0A4R5B534_9ACTN|nr:hypothetical protein [Actinomadura rubrisoli]TDD80911.1 hypothetical protein E1298_24975 [Actinomadura rubrisoli]